MHTTIKRGWLAWGCLLGATHAVGAVTEADFLDEIPVVLSASRLPQSPADAPAAVTVIDREMIRASGFTDIVDLFRLVPGFSVAHVDGLLSTLTYHGLGDGYARRFQVLIDGVSVYSPDFGQVYWRNLPLALEDIDRIEVVRGPAPASYGANAFMGVINIITRSGEDGARAGAMAGAGGSDYREWVARVGGAGEAGSWRLSAGQRTDDYYPDLSDTVRDRYADLRGDWRISGADTLTVEGGVAHTHLDDDVAAGRTYPVNINSGYGLLRWQRVYDSGAETRLSYSLTQQNYGDAIDLGTPLNLDFSARRQNLAAGWTGALSEAVRAAIGAEYRLEEVQSRFYYNREASIRESSWIMYGNGEFRLAPEWLANAGLMLEATHAGQYEFSPRLTLHYQPQPTQSFRLGYNLGYRVPTYYEMFGQNELDFGFGPDALLILPDSLKSERIISREIGWWQAWPSTGVTLDMRAFYDNYSKLIDFALVPFDDGQDGLAYQFFNAGDATVTGVEFDIEWKPAAGTRIQFTPAWVQIQSADPAWRESAPSYSFSVLADHALTPHWRISGVWSKSAAQRWLGDGGQIDSADRLDLRLAWGDKQAGVPLEVAVIGRQLDGGDAEYVPDRQTERQALLQFRAGF